MVPSFEEVVVDGRAIGCSRVTGVKCTNDDKMEIRGAPNIILWLLKPFSTWPLTLEVKKQNFPYIASKIRV